MGAVKRVKNVEWEKNRRERLNFTFLELSRLLPDHDPTLTLTKLEILTKSITYIKELQERNIGLLGINHDEALDSEMTSLREQVVELQRRNLQLAELLQAAKITLPPRPVPHDVPMKCPRKWEGKLSPSTGAKNMTEKKKVELKENPVSRPPLCSKKKSNKIKKKPKIKELKNRETKVRKNSGPAVNNTTNPLRELNNASAVQSVPPKNETAPINSSSVVLKQSNSPSRVHSLPQPSKTNFNKISVTNSGIKVASVPLACASVKTSSVPSVPVTTASVQTMVVISRPNTLPCTTISLVLSNSKTGIVTVAKSNVLPAPIMATGIQPVLQCNPSLSSLGPGTLIMPGGRIVPVPPPPTVLAPTLILLPPSTTTTTAATVATTKSSQKPTNMLRPIVPKPRHRDITKTTFANKVPIPAISTQRCFSGPKLSQNDHELGTKKNVKKKIIMRKPIIKEKCITSETAVFQQSGENISQFKSSNDSVNDDKKLRNDSKCPENDILQKMTTVEQCKTKRKFEIVQENTKGPKIAKIDENPIENKISCTNSKDASQNNKFSKIPSPQKFQSDVGSKERACQAVDSVAKHGSLHFGEKEKATSETSENLSLVGNLVSSEVEPFTTGSSAQIQNHNVEHNIINPRDSNVTSTSESINCENVNFCTAKQNSQYTVDESIGQTAVPVMCPINDPKDNPQISGKDNGNSNCNLLKHTAGLKPDKTILKDVYCKVDQHTSQTYENGKNVLGLNSYYMLKPTSADAKANDDNDHALHAVKNTGKNITYTSNYQQTIHSHLKDTAKQKSEDFTVKDAFSKDTTQKGRNISTTSNSNSSGKLVDSSTQINLNFGAKSNQRDVVLNQNPCASNYNDSPVSLHTSLYNGPKQKDQIEELTANKNMGKSDHRNQTPASDRDNSNSNMQCSAEQQKRDVNTINIPSSKHHNPEGTSNLGAERNIVAQPDHKHNKSANEPVLSEEVFPSETANVINVNPSENKVCHGNSCQNNNLNTSDQPNICINIYTKERKESIVNPPFNDNEVSGSNLKTIQSINNVHASPNSRNNHFNYEQSLSLCPDTNSNNSNNNNPNLYNGSFNYHESVQKNVSNQTLPVPSKQSNNTVHFANLHSNNSMKADVNAQTNNSTNLYNKLNCHKQQTESINVGNVENQLQNNPMSGNYNFMKIYTNTNSASNVLNSSTKNSHFIGSQNQNTLSNSSLASNITQNVTDTSFLVNDQSKHVTKTTDSNNITQSLSLETNHKGSNQHHVNVPTNVAKNSNFQSQQEVSKDSSLPNKFHVETLKTSVSQSCKSTQVTSVQLNFSGNEKNMPDSKQQTRQNPINSGVKKAVDDLKSVCESKSLVHNDSQELTGLFPTEKLQSCSDSLFRDTCAEFRDRNLFMPVNHNYMEEMRLNLPHSDFSNDLLSSLQVPSSGQHPESISPTAAFLLAFPLVSTSKTSDLITENDGSESQHATPTTILQIGNIEPSSNELFHQTALMMENNPNLMKQSKNVDTNKDISSKQIKDIEAFNKFQQIEINELMRNENFSRNNCKDKKTFVGLGEQDVFYQCTKKKGNGKNNNYPLPPSMAPHMPDKTFEFSESNTRSNPEGDRQIDHSEKKSQNQSENRTSSQVIYNVSSQPYSYNSFSSSNDFMLPNSSYVSSNNHHVTESSKSVTQASSNFNVLSWTTASITTNSTQLDYTTPYCNYAQKPFNNTNQVKTQKQLQNNFEDQRIKEKPTSNINPLPKFSNFQFSNNHSNQELQHGYLPNQADTNNYKPEQKVKKLKTGPQRAPVNWMTAPDVRPLLPDNSVATANPDVLFQQQKEMDFSNAPNNMMMLNSSSNITPFNTSTSTSNNSQSFYSNTHFSGVDLQMDFAPFPDISTSKPLRDPANVPNSQQNPHPYSWSPSKSTIPLIPHIDSHMIPSTLPTLVGDLALGTTTPSGPVDTFRNLSMPTTPFNIETPVKKFDKKQEITKAVTKNNEKDCFPNSERRNNRTVAEYCQKTHNHQSTNTSSSFLSVSQLVDQVKTDQNPSSRRTTKQSGAKSNNTQKRNTGNQHSDKSKVSSNINNQINYHNSNPIMSQRKFDTHAAVYHQEVHNAGVGFPGAFPNQGGPAPWQTDKPLRSTTHYKGSYSAESLIADQTTPVQGHISELPQFPNQYSHPPVVSSSSYPAADFAHQNVQPLEFHQTHQNCFNFPSNSQYSSGTFNSDSDYHLGLDHLFNFNPTSNKPPSSCQTTKDNRSSGKRGQSKQRREEFTPQWAPHVYSPTMRPKVPPPPHCPPSTSSPSHQGTTTLTNFNLSTIFPEINDKVGMTGSLATSNFPPPPNFRSH